MGGKKERELIEKGDVLGLRSIGNPFWKDFEGALRKHPKKLLITDGIILVRKGRKMKLGNTPQEGAFLQERLPH